MHSTACAHVLPRSRGGTSNSENLVTACSACTDA
ncbi:MAG: HNH endonuclease [Aldersonia sp.]|nr:HNH endonuclease [Aldersonia sp.]